MSVWSCCWWLGTTAVIVLAGVLLCLVNPWGVLLVFLAFASCAADAVWGIWE